MSIFDVLCSGWRDAQRKEREAQLKQFSSVDDVLIHLAGLSPKERAAFLRPWAIGKIAPGLGRKKSFNSWGFWMDFEAYKTGLENKRGKKLSDKEALVAAFDEAKVPVEKADKQIKTLQNLLGKERAKAGLGKSSR
jgi:hypothetical protein